MAPKSKVIIGRVDVLSLPEFDLDALECKIDTGAALSAIHCHSVKVVEKDGEEELWFKLLDKKHPQYQCQYYKTKHFRERNVRNSFGQEQKRFSFITKTQMMGKTYKCEFTLADREKMKYPVLVGRNLLRQGFVVDVAKSNISLKESSKKSTK